MKSAFNWCVVLGALLLSVTIGGCQLDGAAKENDCSQAPAQLAGYWQLTRLECYCPQSAPVADEAVEFDGNGRVTYYRNGQVVGSSTYQQATGPFSCADGTVPLLTVRGESADELYSYSLSGCTLVLDRGLCFDASRKTYQRVLR